MKENQITVIIKEPNKPARIETHFENTLEAFQEAVVGYIETVTLASDLVIICNEEGRLRGLEYNATVCGVSFVGTIIFAAYNRDGDFVSIKKPEELISLLNI